MEYDVALKEGNPRFCEKFLDAEKAELVEEKEEQVKDEKRKLYYYGKKHLYT